MSKIGRRKYEINFNKFYLVSVRPRGFEKFLDKRFWVFQEIGVQLEKKSNK